MIYEYLKASEKNLSAFMADVIKREGIAKQDVIEIKDSIRKVLDRLEEQDAKSKDFREKMLPVLDAYEKSLTIREFVQSSGKLVINLGLIVGAITAIKIYFFK